MMTGESPINWVPLIRGLLGVIITPVLTEAASRIYLYLLIHGAWISTTENDARAGLVCYGVVVAIMILFVWFDYVPEK